MRVRVGIDEVGRGCLAGPVTVCAVLIDGRFRIPKDLPELRDSKKMTKAQRETWYEWIKDQRGRRGVYYALASVSPEVIDRINIARAANKAAWRAFKKLIKTVDGRFNVEVVLDGGLFLKNRLFQENILNSPAGRSGGGLGRKISINTVVRADARFTEVKMASIVAKVTRDAKMTRTAKRYPDYGFEAHKGYGTPVHIKAIRDKGATDGLHRKTFIGGLT